MTVASQVKPSQVPSLDESIFSDILERGGFADQKRSDDHFRDKRSSSEPQGLSHTSDTGPSFEEALLLEIAPWAKMELKSQDRSGRVSTTVEDLDNPEDVKISVPLGFAEHVIRMEEGRNRSLGY